MNIEIEKIPKGHEFSFRKGCSDALLKQEDFKKNLPNGHNLSYEKGFNLGKKLLKNISSKQEK